jgi:hypothetical protein
MRKIPHTWTLISKPTADVLEYEVPVTHRATLDRLAGWNRPNTGVSFGSIRFHTDDGVKWVRLIRIKNPAILDRLAVAVVYGGKDKPHFVRYPEKLPWRKTILPALNRLNRKLGVSFNTRGDNQAYIEGTDVDFDKTELGFERYDYRDGEFVKV